MMGTCHDDGSSGSNSIGGGISPWPGMSFDDAVGVTDLRHVLRTCVVLCNNDR